MIGVRSNAGTHQMKTSFTSLILALLLVTLPIYGDSTQESTAEYKVKAALIYKLTKFIEWPKQAFEQPESPLEICILGSNPFGSALNALEQRQAGDHPISIKHHFHDMEEIKSTCHMLFINAAPKIALHKILNTLMHRPILTISDTKHFAEQGGTIQLVHQNQRIGLKINLNPAKHVGLKIAAPLLNLSTVIQTTEERDN